MQIIRLYLPYHDNYIVLYVIDDLIYYNYSEFVKLGYIKEYLLDKDASSNTRSMPLVHENTGVVDELRITGGLISNGTDERLREELALLIRTITRLMCSDLSLPNGYTQRNKKATLLSYISDCVDILQGELSKNDSNKYNKTHNYFRGR